MDRIEETIGYRLTDKIAEGGMGVVYRVEQEGFGGFRKTVAIKLISEGYSNIPEFQSNFVGEAKLVADLIHTNIVQTYHLGFAAGRCFMVMEYVNGYTLEEFLAQHLCTGKRVPVDLAAFIVSRICRGLAYAHAKRDAHGELLGIVHRDVNPRNVMLGKEGDVKLTDFGIAKAKKLMYSEEGQVIAGKDGYLSPEQARREVTDARADLFSCGIILNELLLGQNPFDCEDDVESRRRICEMPTPRPSEWRDDVDEGLAEIVCRSLERDRERRFQSAVEMLTAIELYLYSDGYGPTNEKLAVYLRDLFAEGRPGENAQERDTHSALPGTLR